jgi:VanZ family protein
MTATILRTLAAVWAIVVLVLSLAPPRFRIVTGVARDLEHFAAFALVGLIFVLAYPKRRLRILAVGIAATAAVELLQRVVPGRHAYLADFFVNALGLCAGAVCALVLARAFARDNSLTTPSAPTML